MIKQYVGDLRTEFAGYSSSKFRADLMAGITVAAVALPLALAFGVSSGADAAAGLITAIIGGIVIGLLSGASFQISGPTGAMTAILIPVVSQYGLQGMFLATLLAGIILIVAGILKMGRLVSIIPMPVITGFTSGIAIIIALGQIDNFFGTKSVGETAIMKILSYGELGFAVDWKVMVLGLIVIALMVVWPKKWQSVFPSSLASIILVTVINALILNWDVAVVGEIPRTFLPENRLVIADIRVDTVMHVLVPAFSIAVLGMIESLLCGASAGRMKDEVMNADRELMAQGIGSLIIPFFGGVPATAAIARTSVAVKSGQQTRLTSVIHSVGLLASMMLLAPIMSQIPMSALAGVLIVTAWKMNDWELIRHLFGKKLRGGSMAFVLTMLATVMFDLSIAILVGITFAAVMFTVKISNTIEVTISNIDPTRFKKEGLAFHPKHERVRVVYVTGVLFFGSSGAAQRKLERAMNGADGLILSLRGLSACDSTGLHTMLEFCQRAKKDNTDLYFTGLQKQVMEDFERGGVVGQIGKERFLWSTEDALELLIEE